MSSARKIGVLLGGLSLERDVSVRAAEAVMTALRKRGHDAHALFVDRHVDMALRQSGIDVAFLAMRGRCGADGCLQGLLEMLAIPYTGSGVMACSLAMNRAKTKEVLRLRNLPAAPAYLIRAQQQDSVNDIHGAFGFPVVVRAVSASLLFGGTLVRDEMELESAIDDVFALDDEALVERSEPDVGPHPRRPTRAGRRSVRPLACRPRAKPRCCAWQLRLARPWVAKDRPASKWW
jgi:D-alanine-D-alanine ligase